MLIEVVQVAVEQESVSDATPGNHPPVSPAQGNPGGQQSGTRHGGGGGAKKSRRS